MPPLILKEFSLHSNVCRTLLFWTARWWKKSHVTWNTCWNLCPQKLVTRGHDRRVSASTGGSGWVFGQFLFSTCLLPFCCGTTQIQQSRLPCFVSLYAWTILQGFWTSLLGRASLLRSKIVAKTDKWTPKRAISRRKICLRTTEPSVVQIRIGGTWRVRPTGARLSADPNDGPVSKNVLAPFAVPIFIFVLSEDGSMLGNDGG
jgi:hypothetical protein